MTWLRKNWRLTAALLVSVGILSAMLFYSASPWLQDYLSGDFRARGTTADSSQAVALIISSLGVVVSTIGTGFTIALGLRHERREVVESTLKIKELEIELARAVADNPARSDKKA